MSKKRIIKIDNSDLQKIKKYGSSTFSNITIQLVKEGDFRVIEIYGGYAE